MTTAGPRATLKRFDEVMLRGATVHYLFDLTWAGQTFRLSRSSLEVLSTASGEILQYEGILEDEIEWEEALELFSDTSESVSFPFSVVLPVNVPQLVAQGHDLATATGVLALWVEGTNYEDRRILLQGRLTEPEYGWEEDPITASLQAEFFEDAALIPPPTHLVTEETWANAVEDSLGLAYPFMFGVQTAHPTATVYLSQAILVDDSVPAAMIAVVADHPVEANAVDVKDGEGNIANLTITGDTDGVGRAVSVVTFDTTGGVPPVDLAADSTYFVDWSGTDGGHPDRGNGTLSGAGDLLEHMLSLTTVDVDHGRVAAAKDLLNRFRLAGVIEEPVSPYAWIVANLLPILPISLVMGPRGVYPIVWRYWAGQNDIVERIDLDIDKSIEMDGPVAYDGSLSSIVNSFKLRYHLDIDTGEMASVALLGPTRGALTASSLICERSALRYDEREREYESTIIYEAATAGLVVDWWAQARALPSRLISYLVGYDRAWLERGMVVGITDPELFLTDQVALIESMVTREDNNIRMTVRILDQIAHKLHTGA